MGTPKTSSAPAPSPAPTRPKRGRGVGAVAGFLLLVGGVLWGDWWLTLPDDAQASFVGRQKCIDCHQEQTKHWTGSHHDLAMDRATDETVLGDFNDVEFTHHDLTSRMFRRGEKFFINTEGPDGRMEDFEVKYTFGVTPLQQYMVEFDRPAEMPDHEVARLQVLRICWDTKAKKWFYLAPPDVKERLAPDDDLHWTGIAQRWNHMCADCHSTNLRRNFDVAAKTYHTTFTEIDVSCESCHGPGSLHVRLAESPGVFKWDRKRGFALTNLKSSDNNVEIEACAACHSRRRPLCEGFGGGKLHDCFAPEVLSETGYHADGQILDEVYEYGSFTQSKMYHKGVRCTDCHDPHSLQPKFEGNKLCTSCHAHPAGKYDTPNHHKHKDGSKGGLCVECHMPATTYMEVDPRRDHSLRIPRPDLSVKLQTPNACTGCHLTDAKLPESVDRTPLKEYADWLRAAREGNTDVKDELARLDAWADKAVGRWYGASRKQDAHFASPLTAARRGDPKANEKLRDLLKDRRTPAIARATAAVELGVFVEPGNEAVRALTDALDDPSPQIRAAAVMSLMNLQDDGILAGKLAPLLNDPTLFVRIEAARALAHVDQRKLRPVDVRRRTEVLKEFKDSTLIESDRASAHLVLGSIFEATGDDDAAEAAYRTAIQVETQTSVSRKNLAAVLERKIERAIQNDQRSMQQGLPRDKDMVNAELGRIQSEIDDLRRQELKLLERDARLAPNNASIQHLLGLSLFLHNRMSEAEIALKRACELAPTEGYYDYHLAIFYRDTKRPDEALEAARQAVAKRPESESYRLLWEELGGR